jgi:hypothetical protein
MMCEVAAEVAICAARAEEWSIPFFRNRFIPI